MVARGSRLLILERGSCVKKSSSIFQGKKKRERCLTNTDAWALRQLRAAAQLEMDNLGWSALHSRERMITHTETKNVATVKVIKLRVASN